MELPILPPGKRLFLAGATGSGKSTWMRYFMAQIPQHVIVLDTKGEFADIAITVTKSSDIFKAIETHRMVAYVPPVGENSAQALDALIVDLHEYLENVCLAVDEAYAIHNSGRAGDGLIAWITRGRSLGQSLIACSQRPAWVSQMLLSESEIVGAGTIRLLNDRKRLTDATGCTSFMIEPKEPHTFRFFDAASGKSGLFKLQR